MSANEVASRPTFSAAISTKGYQKLINNTIKDPARAQRFVAAITSAVAVNPTLQTCDPSTILSAALLGESLNLSPSPQLGQYYLVPYWNKKKGCNDAQFQLGYKGYVQLALRSGSYKRLNVLAIKQGELKRFDPLTEDVVVELIPDEIEREKAPTIGYLAMFEYLNGFTKTIYWSREKMLAHADRYSQAFSIHATTTTIKGRTYQKVSFADYEAGNYPKQDEWLYSSHWYKDFDAMAFKTMLRQLISKWGIMSVDLQTAMEQDDFMPESDYLTAQDVPAPVPAIETPDAAPEPAPESPDAAPVESVNLDDLVDDDAV